MYGRLRERQAGARRSSQEPPASSSPRGHPGGSVYGTQQTSRRATCVTERPRGLWRGVTACPSLLTGVWLHHSARSRTRTK